jgi:hypothetical protein
MERATTECVDGYYEWERCTLDARPCCERIGAPCQNGDECCSTRCELGTCVE